MQQQMRNGAGGGGAGGQFGHQNANQQNYFLQQQMAMSSPYQQQQGTPLSNVQSPGSASLDASSYQLPPQQQQQPHYQYMAASPAPSELSRQLGFGGGNPASIGSPASSSAAGFRGQPVQMMMSMNQPNPTMAGSGGDFGSHQPPTHPPSLRGGPDTMPSAISDQLQHQQHPRHASNSLVASLLEQSDGNAGPSAAAIAQSHMHQTASHAPTLQQMVPKQEVIAVDSMHQQQNQPAVAAKLSVARAAFDQVGKLLEDSGPLALCTQGKELTQDLVNRTVDMFGQLKTMFDKSFSVPGQSTTLRDREPRFNENLKHTANLMHMLMAISARLERVSAERLPTEAQSYIQKLLPFVDETGKTDEDGNLINEQNVILDEIWMETQKREDYHVTVRNHELAKRELEKDQEELRKIMDFLRSFCWETSAVLENASKQEASGHQK